MKRTPGKAPFAVPRNGEVPTHQISDADTGFQFHYWQNPRPGVRDCEAALARQPGPVEA